MKYIIPILMLVTALCFSACNWIHFKRIEGSGNRVTETRPIEHAEKIRLGSIFDVEITKGPTTSVKVEADDNILPYVVTRMENGFLLLELRDHIYIGHSAGIKVYITTDRLEELRLSGSGNITGKGKFTGADKLKVKVSGIGNMNLDVNTPEVEAEISGSGSVSLSGETRNEQVRISGIGSYKGEDLKAESVKVRISGAGNAKVFADKDLDIHVSGIGSVYYKGAASITQSISGTGSVHKID
ncbi:head GIN domain-containing protein [Asinibacterium sp. OR53]|uniref:head GIN domain-containing protein n=1 Tax=Asinibacterium sp. OR53 TaxID=925409 RepID=UPI0004788741|nr:head GIN domain-containing protein [Asinibacterium sp. OR53]